MKIKNYFLILALCFFHFAFAQTGMTTSGTITVGGTARTYTFYVPSLYNSANAVPLVFNMHGLTGTSALQETAEDFRKIADTANFIVVHPQGLNQSPLNQPGWDVLGTVAAWDSDKVFIINLLEKLASQYSIDRNRVYLTGYSEGGFMSYDFACFVSARFAAIASVCGSLTPSHFTACTPTQPTPVMEIHGTNDQVIVYAGNGVLTTSTNVDTMINYWVKYNHCHSSPDSVVKLADITDSATIDKSTVVHYVYKGGTNGATVELYKVLNGGHQIPSLPPVPTGYGTGNTNEDFTAAKEIWRFFRKYSLNGFGVTPVVGTISITATATSVNQVTINNAVSIYPNPSNGTFIIDIDNYENTSFQLLNVLGTVVYEGKIIEKTTRLNLNNLTKGIYIFKISNLTEVLKNGKLIID